MLGLGDRGRVVDLFEHLMKGDAAAALHEFRAQYDAGADPATILTDLAEFTHLVTRLRFVPDAAKDASLSEDERSRGTAFAQSLSLRVLSRTWQMLLKGIPEVQAANRPVSAGEMVLIRIAHAANLPTLDEALKSLDDGSARSASAAAGAGFRAGRWRQRRFGCRRDPRDRAQWRRPDDAPRRGRACCRRRRCPGKNRSRPSKPCP